MPPQTPPTEYAVQVRAKVEALIAALCQGLYERETAMKLALLSAVAGESIFLLGPPGVGKSLIARRLKFAFSEGRSFEYLMSRFSTPDEIFGPVSIRKLKEEDKYERLTDKYLPGANIVFLDEIWKSGPAIQNALLTILNEKVYRNGEQEVWVDIKGIITASNELPPSGESFQPLWDRFLVRYIMEGVRDRQNFLRLITDTQDVYADDIAPELKIGKDELAAWGQAIDAVVLPPEVLNTIQVLRHKFDTHNEKPGVNPLQVFDRRWKKIVRLLRAAAFLNGRTEVDLMDCFLMVHCLWSEPGQAAPIQEMLAETIRKHGYSIALNLHLMRREVQEFEAEVAQETRIPYAVSEARLEVFDETYYEIAQEDKPFQGERIRAGEFQQLAADEYQIVNIYDRSGTLRHRLKARRSAREHAIDISYNSLEQTYQLRTHQVERKDHVFKAPHPLLQRHWDERIGQLRDYIGRQQGYIEAHAPAPVQHLEHNLFVPSALAAIVRANLDEVREGLEALLLRLDKLQFAYMRS
ncbi:MAG: hypothetical protein OHK0039_15000 [Bacteroidia bacterium]